MKKNILKGATLSLTLSVASSLALVNFTSAATITTERCDEFLNAVNAAESGDTIVLGLNCSKHLTIDGNRSITIDLAGNRLSEYDNYDVITVAAGSTLNVIDSVGGGVLKAGNTSQFAINNAGTANADNVTIWGDSNNSGALNFEEVTLDPEDYYPYPTYKIVNSGTFTTSGDPTKNLFKGTPFQNTGTVELTAATFTVRPDDSFVPEGHEIVEQNNKFIVRPIPTTPSNDPSEPSNTDPDPSNNQDPVNPTDQTLPEEDPSLDPLGETHTVKPAAKPAVKPVANKIPTVPNTGSKEEVKEASSSSDINLILFAMAFGFGTLVLTTFIKGKHAAKEAKR